MGKKFTDYTLEDVVRLQGGFFKIILAKLPEEQSTKFLETLLFNFNYLKQTCETLGKPRNGVLLADSGLYQVVTNVSNGNCPVQFTTSLKYGTFKMLSIHDINEEGFDPVKFFNLNEVALELSEMELPSSGESEYNPVFVESIFKHITDSGASKYLNPDVLSLYRLKSNIVRDMERMANTLRDLYSDKDHYQNKLYELQSDIDQCARENERLDQEYGGVLDQIDSCFDSAQSERLIDDLEELMDKRICYPYLYSVSDSGLKLVLRPFSPVKNHLFNPSLDLDRVLDFGYLGVYLNIPKNITEFNLKVCVTDGHFLKARNYVHPNVSPCGSLCFGAGTNDATRYNKTCDLYNYVKLVFTVLNTYSPDNPYIQHHNFYAKTLRFKPSYATQFMAMTGCYMDRFNYFNPSDFVEPEESQEESSNESVNQ